MEGIELQQAYPVPLQLVDERLPDLCETLAAVHT
jgi:hypothetical protein